jgi:hypothetical protein
MAQGKAVADVYRVIEVMRPGSQHEVRVAG